MTDFTLLCIEVCEMAVAGNFAGEHFLDPSKLELSVAT